ncbi:hypothetical protein AAE478_010376 [Parahypoxylon ruwenzoriense]
MAVPRSYMHRSPSAPAESESKVKPWKIRKGTRSCWERKRRKVRCTFASLSDAICVECQRRGANRLGQEHHEDSFAPSKKGLSHPVLLAKRVFLIATLLQYLDPESHEQIKYMSESPRVIMKRLADTAARLVTTNDNMLGIVEGLECVMMEGIY